MPRSDLLQRIAENFQPGRLGRHAGIQVAQMLLTTGARTLVLLIVVPLFGPVLYGILNLFLNSLTLMGRIADGVGQSLVRSIAAVRAKDEGAAAGFAVRGALAFSFVIGGASILFALLLAYLFPEFFHEYRLAILLTLLLALFSFARLLFEYSFRALRLYGYSFLVALIVTPIQTVTVLWLVYQGYRVHGYLAVLAAEAALATVGLIGILLWYRGKRRGRVDVEAHTLMPVATYSLPLVLRGLIGFCFLRINIFLVGAVSSAEEVGYYALADRFLLVPQLILGAYLAALAPRFAEGFARGDLKGVGFLAHRSYAAVLLLMVPFILLFAGLYSLFTTELFSAFMPAWPVMMLFAASLPVLALAGVATNGLMIYGGKAHITLWASALVAVLNVGLCLLLAGRYGALGAGIAVFAASWIGGIVELVVASWVLRIPFRIRMRFWTE